MDFPRVWNLPHELIGLEFIDQFEFWTTRFFDILQDWGMKGCPNFAGFSFFASGFRQVVRSTKYVHACAVTYLETTTFWKSDATTYFLLNRQMMEARKIFLHQSVVKPDLDIYAMASYAKAVQLR